MNEKLIKALELVIRNATVYRPEGRSWITGPDGVLTALKEAALRADSERTSAPLQRAHWHIAHALEYIGHATDAETRERRTKECVELLAGELAPAPAAGAGTFDARELAARPALSEEQLLAAFDRWYEPYPDTTSYMDGMFDAFKAGYALHPASESPAILDGKEQLVGNIY